MSAKSGIPHRDLLRDGRVGPSQKDLAGSLSSALLVADKELGNLVHEVERISKALKLDATGKQALRVAIHPAVWGAVRHVIVERVVSM